MNWRMRCLREGSSPFVNTSQGDVIVVAVILFEDVLTVIAVWNDILLRIFSLLTDAYSGE